MSKKKHESGMSDEEPNNCSIFNKFVQNLVPFCYLRCNDEFSYLSVSYWDERNTVSSSDYCDSNGTPDL